ncbi:MAG: hypothetical protein HFE33_03100 [Clostridia bacterium]|jgi:hypothetical protein|nr:hypothetical protein [Clostridia bacterium]
MITKTKKITVISILLVAVLLFALISTFAFAVAYADTEEDVKEEVQPRGLMCKISISLKGDKECTMTATAKNEFTLGKSTIRVIVELYSADFYAKDSSEMTLVASNEIADLNIYKSISVSEYTYNKMLFWCARVRFKLDSEPWETKETSVILYDANANKLV